MLERVSDFIFTKKKSYRFIFFSILFLNQFLLLSTVQAKIFNINKSADFQLRKEVIKEIILDYENYCEQGCKYKLTGIKEMKILEILDANHIFTWTYVDNIKKYKYFSHVEVKESDSNIISIHNKYPSLNEVKRLKTVYQLPHSTPFITSKTVWTIEEKFDQKGKWSHTHVTYVGEFNADSLTSVFASAINKNLRITANDLFQNISQFQCGSQSLI